MKKMTFNSKSTHSYTYPLYNNCQPRFAIWRTFSFGSLSFITQFTGVGYSWVGYENFLKDN